ncbi:endonuclease/exonuclease/phosphatase family protein [Algibacter sp. R77976]|uniref:endonuclease/exonuclease/phosphatase family protein n=1 Tax=Algibacter sp. R77976 TaxID=3093873 RepID=UPI0037C8C932
MQFNTEKEISISSSLSLLSFNTNGFMYEQNIEHEEGEIARFIKSENPDVFCIQEFSAIKYKFFKDYPYWYKTNIFTKGKSVMAIFSKFPIKDKGYISFPNSNNGGMYVDVIFNKEEIRIYNIHLESYRMDAIHQLNNPNSYSPIAKRIGNAIKTRKEQAIQVKNHIDAFNGKVIICGDFNSTQFSSIYNVLKASKKDSFVEAGFGFGKTYGLYNYPFRLDYILVDDKFEVLSHQNFNLKLSDHEPVLVKLALSN